MPTLFATSIVRNIDLETLALVSGTYNGGSSMHRHERVSGLRRCARSPTKCSFLSDDAYNAINDFIQPVIPYLATPLANARRSAFCGTSRSNSADQFLRNAHQAIVPPGVGRILQILAASAESETFEVTQPDPADGTTTGMDLPMSIGAYATQHRANAPYVAPLATYSSGMPAFTRLRSRSHADGTPALMCYRKGMAISGIVPQSNGLRGALEGSPHVTTVAPTTTVCSRPAASLFLAGLLFLIAPRIFGHRRSRRNNLSSASRPATRRSCSSAIRARPAAPMTKAIRSRLR